MAKQFICLVLLATCFFITSAHQPPEKGIEWTKGLTFQQIKEKARRENKYIFLDCFATWCGPCKQMDKTVYVNDTVGSFFNERFIAVKVQMDKTKKDEEEVRNWYGEAQAIQKQYRVRAFPTYIFLSPQGQVVHIDKGYQHVGKFMTTVTLAVQPGRVYVDKYEEFDFLEADYDAGIRHYNRMLYMMQAARELGKTDLLRILNKDYMQYLESLEKEKLYTKENMEFLASGLLKSSSPLFQLFYPNGKNVDKVIGMKGYAQGVVDRVLFKEITIPFLGIRASSGMLGGKTDTAEADWEGLYGKLMEKYPTTYADRVLLDSRIAWYDQHFNRPKLYKYFLEKLDTYGMDTTSKLSNTSYSQVNWHCWFLFLSMDDRSLLQRAANHMHTLVKARQRDYTFRDTYANILYKLGETEKAIEWEESALQIVKGKKIDRQVDVYTAVLAKMRAGKPTWPVKK